MLNISKFQEIFSSWTHKTDHFLKIRGKTGVPYNEMLFFDDENRNIEAVRSPPLLLSPCVSSFLFLYY